MINTNTPDLLTSSELWMQKPLEQVYIQSLHPLRSNYHVACVEARSTVTDMIKIFQFTMTKQELGAYAYLIEPGCIIMDRSGTYECLAVSYGKKPKVPVVLARPIIRFDSSNAGDRFKLPTFLDNKAHIRDRFILYKEWFTLPVAEVNIESVIFKKGEHDFRWSVQDHQATTSTGSISLKTPDGTSMRSTSLLSLAAFSGTRPAPTDAFHSSSLPSLPTLCSSPRK